MDEDLEFLLKSVFEMGYNRGLGRVASPIVIDTMWAVARDTMLAESPTISHVALHKVATA